MSHLKAGENGPVHKPRPGFPQSLGSQHRSNRITLQSWHLMTANNLDNHQSPCLVLVSSSCPQKPGQVGRPGGSVG